MTLVERLTAKLPRLRSVSSRRRYSVVSAVYDVAPYLDAFMRSLARQTLDFDRHIELILVDDGSRDGSAEIIRCWQATHPRSIHCIRKENGGQASARNVGLEHASGDWVTFIDPDDFVHERYFESVDALLDRADARDVVMVGCKIVVHRRGRSSDEHALRTQFQRGDRVVTSDETPAPIQLSAASAFFRGDLLRAQRHRFDEDLRPTFEDGAFVGLYRVANPGPIALCARASYLYRKRDDSSSTVDRSWSHPGRYDAVLARGYLHVLSASAAASASKRPSAWAQRTVLYDLLWYLRVLVDHPEVTAFLSPEQRARFVALLRQCFDRIEPDIIERFDLAEMSGGEAVGMLGFFKGTTPRTPRVRIDAFDDAKRAMRIRSSSHVSSQKTAILLGGAEVDPDVTKERRRELLGETFAYETITWIQTEAEEHEVQAKVGGVAASIEVDGLGARSGQRVRDIARALGLRSRLSKVAWYHRAERRLATHRIASRRYRDALLYIDRDSDADDNAEHLYRHTVRTRPQLPAFFILRRSSPDWARLERDGFRLIPFGSLQHRVALLNAKHLISSHAEPFVLGWPTVRHRRHLQKSRFTFLQHGVIQNDLSAWLNKKDIDCFITSSPAEHESIVADGSPYQLTRREVILTGLPRHDALRAGPPHPERVVLIMPTWRQGLVGRIAGKSSARSVNPAFFESEFGARWKSLLHSTELHRLLRLHGYRAQFFPHPNLVPYLDWFGAPAGIETLSKKSGASMQAAFRTASVMVTDYSSTAFEMAYLDKSVVYYQFDRESTFGGAHTMRTGYFDYGRDGFGPVCVDEDALLVALERLMTRGGAPDPEHLRRMRAALPFRDGQCSERVLSAILDLDRP